MADLREAATRFDHESLVLMETNWTGVLRGTAGTRPVEARNWRWTSLFFVLQKFGLRASVGCAQDTLGGHRRRLRP